MAASSPSKRRDTDLMRLMMSDFKVHLPDESSLHDFCVLFNGPAETPYEGGAWKVHVTLPPEYPFKSPSIGFMNRLFHPNVDEISGSVCLDVINQTWSPMFDLVNVFSVFLPQLLRYPNPNDPLNGEAANLLLRDADKYNDRSMSSGMPRPAIVMEEGADEQHGKKPRSSLSSSMSSSASTDNESPSPSSSPLMHPMTGLSGMHAVSLSGESSLLVSSSEAGSYLGGSASSSSGSNEESPRGQDEEDDGNDTDVSELSDIDI